MAILQPTYLPRHTDALPDAPADFFDDLWEVVMSKVGQG